MRSNKLKQRDSRRRKRARDFISDYKKCNPCPCGNNNVEVLQFHHVDAGQKKIIRFSRMVANNWGKAAIMKEIEKCQVLCDECHKVLHNGK